MGRRKTRRGGVFSSALRRVVPSLARSVPTAPVSKLLPATASAITTQFPVSQPAVPQPLIQNLPSPQRVPQPLTLYPTIPTPSTPAPVPIEEPSLTNLFNLFDVLTLEETLKLETTLTLIHNLNMMPEAEINSIAEEVYSKTDDETIRKNLNYLAGIGVFPSIKTSVSGGGPTDPQSPAGTPPNTGTTAPTDDGLGRPRREIKIPFKFRQEEETAAKEQATQQARVEKRKEVADEEIKQVQQQLFEELEHWKYLNSSLKSIVYKLINTDKALTPAVQLLFPQEAIDKFTERGKKIRDIYEPTNPTTQCYNVVVNEFELGKTECYICNTIIRGKHGTLTRKSPTEYIAPECEHILPIIQAVFFLDLYRRPRQLEDTKTKETLRLEYDWAHMRCNRLKSDISFIEAIHRPGKPPEIRFSETKTAEILTKITKEDIWAYIDPQSKVNTATWVNERSGVIETGKINPIINHIYDGGKRTPGVVILSGLRNLKDVRRLDVKFVAALNEVLKDPTSRTNKKRERTPSMEDSVSPPPAAKQGRGRRTRRKRRSFRNTKQKSS